MNPQTLARISKIKSKIEQVYSQHHGLPKAIRFPDKIKLEVRSLYQTSGLSKAELAKQIGITSKRVSVWCAINDNSPQASSVNACFKELKVSSSDNSSITQEARVVIAPEARIVTSSGLSIFIPLECLTPSFISSLEQGGMR